MKTCKQCDRVMNRDTSTGAIVFTCHCGIQEDGGPADTRLAGDILNAGETEEMYERLIASAAHDRVNQQIKKECLACGLEYMTQVRVGAREVVVWICKCGETQLRGGGDNQ